jgi:hypothetical protein
MKNQLPEFCTINTATTITCPAGQSIYVVAATAGFTAMGQAITISAPISFPVPFKVTTDITSATTKTIFYYLS